MNAIECAQEIGRYQHYLDMALREVDAGNKRMHAYAESYAKYIGSLQIQLVELRIKAANHDQP